MKKESGNKSLKQKLIAYLLMFAMVASLLPGMTVEAEDGEDTGDHVHSWIYSTDDNKTIKATCSSCMKEVVLNLAIKPSGDAGYIYAGDEYEVVIENIGELKLEKDPKITYSKKGNGGNGDTLGEQQPKDAGTYKAEVAFGGVSMEKEFSIVVKEHKHNWKYEKSGEGILAKCEESDWPKEEVELRLVVTPDSICEGDEYEVVIENIDDLDLSEKPIPEYSKKADGEGENWETPNEQQPKDAGNYKVQVTFGAVSMEKEFTIKEKVHKHDWIYSKVEGEEKIIATCSDQSLIKKVDLRLVVTLETEEVNSFCEGEDYKVNIENIGDLGLSEEAIPEITYSKKADGEGENGDTLDEQPEVAGTYKAQVTFKNADETEVTMATDITIKEHAFGEISEEQLAEKAEWNDNDSKVTVKLPCTNCEKDIEYSSEEIDKTVTTATCVTPGSTTYTATIEIYGNKYVIKKEVKGTINANNHAGPYITSGARAATYNAAGHTGNQICNACKRVTKYGSAIPKKVVRVNRTVYVTWGKTLKINQITPDTSVFQKLTVSNKSKYKKFLSVNERTGTIRVKKYNRAKIKTTIPVKVKVNGKTYSVKVKIKIPAPSKKSFKISKKKMGKKGYKYTFKYNIKGAKKIKVRMAKGGTRVINKDFDRYIKKSKSNRNSYMLYSMKTMKKLKNKVTFKIVVYYGKNKTETLTITK